MALKSLLLVIGLMLCLNFKLNEAIFSAQEKADSIEKWETVGLKGGELGQKNDIASAIALIDALGKAIPYGGPLATLVSGIMGFFNHAPSELSIVLEKLEAMNNKLDHLDKRISEVMVKIESVSIIAGYKSKVEAISKLKQLYGRFISTHGVANNLTRDDFQRECKANKMLEFARWMKDEMSTESQLPLRQVMLQHYDMAEFNYWSSQIAAMLSNAMFLHVTCVGASGYNESTISLTLNGGAGSHGDLYTFKDVVASVHKSFYVGMKQIKRNFFDLAKDEVEEFMRVHDTEWTHEQFVEHLHSNLSKKYYWRSWYLASWDGNTAGFDQHALWANDKNVRYWLHTHKRCLIVGSVLNEDVFSVTQKIDNCHSTYSNSYVHDLADSVNNYMRSCISSITLGGLAVVRFGNGLRSRGHLDFFENGNYNGHDFSVIAIPDDSSATISNEEVCSNLGTTYTSCNADAHCCPPNNCCKD